MDRKIRKTPPAFKLQLTAEQKQAKEI